MSSSERMAGSNISVYELPGGQSFAEVQKPFGDNIYCALVNLRGEYPGSNQMAHDIGRREFLYLFEGEVKVTINGSDSLLQTDSGIMVEDGDYYRIKGRGEMVVFVEDKEGGTTKIEDL